MQLCDIDPFDVDADVDAYEAFDIASEVADEYPDRRRRPMLFNNQFDEDRAFAAAWVKGGRFTDAFVSSGATQPDAKPPRRRSQLKREPPIEPKRTRPFKHAPVLPPPQQPQPLRHTPIAPEPPESPFVRSPLMPEPPQLSERAPEPPQREEPKKRKPPEPVKPVPQGRLSKELIAWQVNCAVAPTGYHVVNSEWVEPSVLKVVLRHPMGLLHGKGLRAFTISDVCRVTGVERDAREILRIIENENENGNEEAT